MSHSHTLFVLSAPSGAGKTSLVSALVEKHPDILVSVSHTTRDMRPGEVDGESYNFVSKDDFLALVEKNDFLEHAEVFGNYYGTSKSWVEKQLEQNDVLLEIDWQGALQVKKQLSQAVLVFILPPSLQALKERLVGRDSDSDEVIKKRLAGAQTEMQACREYDYIVVNDVFDEALVQLESVIVTQSLSPEYLPEQTQQLIESLLK